MPEAAIVRAADLETSEHEWGHVTFFASDAAGPAKDQSLGRCVIRPGQALPKHYHPRCSEIVHVAQGRITHTVASDRVETFEAGDTIIVPAGLAHQAANVGDVDAVLLIAFSAAHREFIVV